MGKYGEVAVQAVGLLRQGRSSAEDAWRKVAEDVFADAPAAKVKGCPREAFLGLCQAGLLIGVPAGRCNQSASSVNRRYATAAVNLLKTNPKLANGAKAELWRRVMLATDSNPNKKPNAQLDVVLALWTSQLIDTAR